MTIQASANARARAITWMFAALSTVEPPIVDREAAVLLDRDKPWYEARLPILDGRFGFGGRQPVKSSRLCRNSGPRSCH